MPHRVDEGLATTLKRVASVLKQAEIPSVEAIAMPVVSAVVPLPGDARTQAPSEVEEIS